MNIAKNMVTTSKSPTTTKICVLTFNRPDWEKLQVMTEDARAKIPDITVERAIAMIVTQVIQRWQPGLHVLPDPSDHPENPS